MAGERARRGGDEIGHVPAGTPGRRIPGKVTLTSRLSGRGATDVDTIEDPADAALHDGLVPVVQREAAAAPPEDPFAIHLIARAGVAGGGAALPHQAAIQASFGAHDVGDVRAHVGGAAAEAAGEIGARAYATGRDVAFAAAPDLRQAAHEAAHVVQQRGGVQLDGGVGAAGDPYERHADAVADRVVRGESAEDLLDGGGANAAAGPAVQREAEPAAAAGPACYEPDQEPGRSEHMPIGTWGVADKVQVRTTTTIGKYRSEAAALAAAHTSGAVILEQGNYVAYQLTTTARFESFTYENCKIMKGKDTTCVSIDAPWRAVTTTDGVVLRPDKFNTDPAHNVMSPEEALRPGASPFAGFAEAFGPGLKDHPSNDSFFDAFTAAMKKASVDVLARSQGAVERKRDQFQQAGGTSADELNTIRKTARNLAAIDRELRDVQAGRLLPTGLEYPAANDSRRELDAKKADLEQRRKAELQSYPLLARQDAAEIARASDDEIARLLGDDTIGMLRDIALSRDDVLTGALDLWAVPSMIDCTLAGLGIADPTRRELITQRAAARQKSAAVKQLTLTVFAVGCGIASSLVTGPLSVAFAAGALGISTYDAINTSEQYVVDKAAANTHLDPTHALVPKDVEYDYLGVVAAWVGVGMDLHAVSAALVNVKRVTELTPAAQALAKGSEELFQKLKIAAGIVGDSDVVSEATRGVIGHKLGTALEIQHGLGTEIRVKHQLDPETGKVVVRGVVCGAEATVKDVLAHSAMVKHIQRYEGLTGQLVELWDRFRSAALKQAAPEANPFPHGTKAWNSWYEVEKLPRIIESRLQQLEKGAGYLTREVEHQLGRDVSILESELAEHRSVVEQVVLEAGADYVRKGEEVTAEALSQGFPFPQVSEADRPHYYYRRGGPHGYELCTMQSAPASVKRFTLLEENGKLVLKEGALTAVQQAQQGWSAALSSAFANLAEHHHAAGAKRVVPLKGVALTERTVGEAFNDVQRDALARIYTDARVRRGLPRDAAVVLARERVDKICNHQITMIHGTTPLREFDYAAYYKGKHPHPIGELHHDLPLYLGGDHTFLTDLDNDLHDELHALINEAKFSDDVSLAPYELAKKFPGGPGAAVISADGKITFYSAIQVGDAWTFATGEMSAP